jgi:hypothetical protein
MVVLKEEGKVIYVQLLSQPVAENCIVDLSLTVISTYG